MSDISSSFDSSGAMDVSAEMQQQTPVRQSHLSKGKLFKGMPLSPLVNKSSGGANLENHGFLVVRKRRSLMVRFTVTSSVLYVKSGIITAATRQRKRQRKF